MGSLFDTVFGLPVHTLVVHATVVLVPLMALVSAVVALRPPWFARGGRWLVAADVALLGLVLLTKESGERFRDRLGDPAAARHHVDLGENMVWFLLALLVITALRVLAARRGSGRVLLSAALVLVALATGGWAVAVGHSGSQAVWGDVVRGTNSP